jgi:hypothetical protein
MRTSPRCASVTKKGKHCLRSENCPKHKAMNAPLKSARLMKEMEWKIAMNKATAKKNMKTNGGAQLPLGLDDQPCTFEEGMAIMNAIFIEKYGRPYRIMNNNQGGK